MIRQNRMRKGWTQQETALSLNVELTTYQRWEYEWAMPHWSRLRDISESLEIDYIELLLHYEIITYEDLHTIRRVKDEH